MLGAALAEETNDRDKRQFDIPDGFVMIPEPMHVFNGPMPDDFLSVDASRAIPSDTVPNMAASASTEEKVATTIPAELRQFGGGYGGYGRPYGGYGRPYGGYGRPYGGYGRPYGGYGRPSGFGRPWGYGYGR